ncbi:MAG: hypothetical protein J6C33_02355 [Lachnospiraceae bacterium]|nr:hypothetical protein [Lachnospiraceae bacterium]
MRVNNKFLMICNKLASDPSNYSTPYRSAYRELKNIIGNNKDIYCEILAGRKAIDNGRSNVYDINYNSFSLTFSNMAVALTIINFSESSIEYFIGMLAMNKNADVAELIDIHNKSISLLMIIVMIAFCFLVIITIMPVIKNYVKYHNVIIWKEYVDIALDNLGRKKNWI